MSPRAGSGKVSEAELAERVCSLDDAIMFCAIMGSHGEIHVTRSRPGSAPFVTKESDVELLARRWAVVRGIDDTADKLLGRSRSAVILRDKVTLMSVNVSGGRCVFVGARPDVDIRKVTKIEQAAGLLRP
jgi:hypothetical protein